MRTAFDGLAARASRALLLVALATAAASAQPGARGGDWRHYSGDLASTKYSPLDQIDRTNVGRLDVAWTWRSVDETGDIKARGGQFKNTPLKVGDRLYVTTSLHQAAALDPATGKTLWVYDPKVYEKGRPTNSGFQHRGLEYWSDGEVERVFLTTGARQLISLDARTGLPDPRFGDSGIVDTWQGLESDLNPAALGHNAPPILCGGTLVLGSIVSDGPTRMAAPPGHVRGYDPRTGKRKWIFHTIPQTGEYGNDTWEDESWRYTGNTNVWSLMSCDEDLGYVYLPVTTPTNDWYGGHRLGNSLFAESLVALDAGTGKRVWHFQAVHHGLWDYDFPCAPTLVDITVDGRRIAAVAQVSKQGFTYVFDRKTGEPAWPIEERTVPQTDVPGDRTSPTQPFPTKPPPFERQGITEADLIDFTPEVHQMALDVFHRYRTGPIFTPPSLIYENGTQGTLQLPSAAGGANWGGAAFDPETGILYVPSMTLAMFSASVPPDPSRSDFRYVGSIGISPMPEGLPLLKPPYGRITAIDLDRGDHVWQVAHGPGPKNHPRLAALNLPDLGSNAHGVLSNGGLVLTKTLLFIIQADLDPTSMLRMGKFGYLRAFDKATGEKVWEQRIEPTPHGTPMTYSHQGRQYLAVATGGNGQESVLMAFALPLENEKPAP